MREHSEDAAIKKMEASGTNSIMLYLNQIDAGNECDARRGIMQSWRCIVPYKSGTNALQMQIGEDIYHFQFYE